MQTVNYPIDKLVFAEYNPRQLTKDQYQNLKDSITRFGLVDPMIVNTHKERKNILVGGHQRVKVAKDLGFEEVPCVEVRLTPDKEKELNIRLNKNTGEWDYDALANHFDVGELTEWGFTDDDLQFFEPEEIAGLIDDDEIPEVEESITKTGDIWIDWFRTCPHSYLLPHPGMCWTRWAAPDEIIFHKMFFKIIVCIINYYFIIWEIVLINFCYLWIVLNCCNI